MLSLDKINGSHQKRIVHDHMHKIMQQLVIYIYKDTELSWYESVELSRGCHRFMKGRALPNAKVVVESENVLIDVCRKNTQKMK